MKILVLTRFANEYEPKRLASVGREAGHVVDIVKYGKIGLEINESGEVKIDLGRNRSLSDYDLIVPRSASKKGSSMVATKTILLVVAKKLGIKIVNGRSFEKYPLLGKIEQGIMMAQAGLPVAPLITFGSKNGWENYLQEGKFEPIIVKGRFGSHGRTVKLVNNFDELKILINKYKKGNVLIQPVLAIEVWYRCIVAGGKYLGETKHRQKKKYKVVSHLAKPDPALQDKSQTLGTIQRDMGRLREACSKATELFDCDYAGIDVGWDEDKKDWVIFEVNRTAQFKYFEKRTMLNVAARLLGV